MLREYWNKREQDEQFIGEQTAEVAAMARELIRRNSTLAAEDAVDQVLRMRGTIEGEALRKCVRVVEHPYHILTDPSASAQLRAEAEAAAAEESPEEVFAELTPRTQRLVRQMMMRKPELTLEVAIRAALSGGAI